MRPSLRQVLFRSAGLDLNFAGGVFSLNNTRTDSPANIPGWSFSRTDTNAIATALDLAGNVIQFPSRTNLLERSQEFDNAYWSKARCTISADTTVAPDGTTTADSLVEDTTSNSHPVFRTVGSLANATAYTWSVFVAPLGRTSCNLAASNTAFGTPGNATFSLSGAGSVSASSGCTAVIQAVAGGFYRCSITLTTVSAGNGDVYVQPFNGGTSYLGNGAAALAIWGAQLETGSTATAYIPTTTAAVTVTPPRITNRGILVEEARTNLMEQSGVPSAWSMTASQNGLTGSVVGTGTENGVPYQEVRAVGTATSTFFDFGAFGSPARTAATSGQSFTGAFSAKIISGGASITAFQASVVEETAGNVFFGQTVASFSLTNGVFNRVAATRTMGATAATCRLARAISFTNGAAVDVTIRFYLPQLELGAFATSPIITTGAAGTRGADLPSIANSAIPSFPFTLLADYGVTGTAQAALGRIVDWGGGNVNTQVLSYRNNTSQTSVQIGNTTNIFPSGRLGIRVQPGTSAASGGGSSVLTFSDVITREAGPMYIGNRQSEDRATNDYIQRIRVIPFAATDAQLQALTAP